QCRLYTVFLPPARICHCFSCRHISDFSPHSSFLLSLFKPAQILRRCWLTYFFSLLSPDPLSDPYPDPEPVTSQWNSHLYVGYVFRKPPANTPGKDPTGLYV